MIIFLYGPDSYRKQQKIREYFGRYQSKFSGISLRKFDFEEKEDWPAFRDFVRSQSLFESSRLGVVSGTSELSDGEKKECAAILKSNLQTKEITIILNEDKKPTKEFAFLLKEPVIHWEYSVLAGNEFQKFLKAEAGKRNLNIDIGAQYILMQMYSGDSWGLVTELDRLALLGKKEITKKVLEKYVAPFETLNVFNAIQQARRSGDLGMRLTLLERLFVQEDPAMIFNIFVVDQYADSGWKRKMADYDVAIKSGKLEYEEVLTEALLTL